MISHSESKLNVQAKTSFKVENLDILLSWLIERRSITTWMKHVSTLSSVQMFHYTQLHYNIYRYIIIIKQSLGSSLIVMVTVENVSCLEPRCNTHGDCFARD